MSEIINVTGIRTVNTINNRSGQYRAIVKRKGGLIEVVDDFGTEPNSQLKSRWKSAVDVMRDFRPGSLQTIEFKAESTNYWISVFARTGKKIIFIDEQILQDLTVGDVNQSWSNTDLYSPTQYSAVNAKTWADKAFVQNQFDSEHITD